MITMKNQFNKNITLLISNYYLHTMGINYDLLNCNIEFKTSVNWYIFYIFIKSFRFINCIALIGIYSQNLHHNNIIAIGQRYIRNQ